MLTFDHAQYCKLPTKNCFLPLQQFIHKGIYWVEKKRKKLYFKGMKLKLPQTLLVLRDSKTNKDVRKILF
jgi:hypothetical protein